MTKLIFMILILVLCITVFAQAQDENYCKDKESWQEWDTLVQRYPHDMDILLGLKVICPKCEMLVVVG